jgi:hypothetical protein
MEGIKTQSHEHHQTPGRPWELSPETGLSKGEEGISGEYGDQDYYAQAYSWRGDRQSHHGVITLGSSVSSDVNPRAQNCLLETSHKFMRERRSRRLERPFRYFIESRNWSKTSSVLARRMRPWDGYSISSVA